MSATKVSRRQMLGTIAAGAFLSKLNLAYSSTKIESRPPTNGQHLEMAPIKQIRAGLLNTGYFEIGPSTGPVVILLHGFPYDIHSYSEVAPLLAEKGCRVIVPHLRGHGTTTFLSGSTPKVGQQSAVAQDIIDLMNSLKIQKAIIAGYDWGARTACAMAALWPERCEGIVSVNGYLIQDIANADKPIPAKIEAALWYQYYFSTARGRAGLEANRRDIAEVIWKNNSPTWKYDNATFNRSMESLDNPDYVGIVIHNYRFRLGLVPGHPYYEDLERKLAKLPAIEVPAITVDGEADGVVPANDGKIHAAKFKGPRSHRRVAGAGHNLPQEAPEAFANAVMELVKVK